MTETCPTCDMDVPIADLRFESEPMTRDDPGYFLRGCIHCLGTGPKVQCYRINPRDRGDDDGREYADPRDGGW